MFSPCSALVPFLLYENAFDKTFFKGFQKVEVKKVEIQPLAKFVILVSTHSCLMTREILTSVLRVEQEGIYARTVLGAGHDLFPFPQLILQVLK